MSLKYKTRLNSLPNKKQNIYFRCHNDDFSKCFELLSTIILSKYDIVIWYNTKTIDNEDEHFTDLSQMKLFIMPITKNLLFTKTYIIDKEYNYFTSSNIPILPILMEEGLNNFFSEKYGDIQYLDISNKDSSAIDFKDKLFKFMDKILIDNDLIYKIKDQFYSYIFLSYRKKDRKHANDLMRLIHSNEAFKGVAIWYDEFLIPGEDFNDQILEKLYKSDLFTLLVTPNLVNENNYIMNIEYPEAKKAGKIIIPAEVVFTDKLLLNHKYPGIPDVIDGKNIKIITENITNKIFNSKTINVEYNPEHQYLLGLAYLNGIDVEVNHDLALKLITTSANLNHVDALHKIIAMYQNGIGVKMDKFEEIKWRIKLINFLQEKYNINQSENNFISFFDEKLLLAKTYVDISDPFNAKEVLINLLNEVHDLENQYLSINFKRKLMLCYQYLGNVELELEETNHILTTESGYVKAEQCYLKALEISDDIYKNTKDIISLADNAICYDKVGNSIILREYSLNKKDKLKARKYYTKSLKLKKTLYDKTKTVEAYRQYAIGLGKLAIIEEEIGCYEEAKTYFLEKHEILDKINRELNSFKTRKDLHISFYQLANFEENQDNESLAWDYYIKSYELRLDIYRETKSIESLKDLQEIYENIYYFCKYYGYLYDMNIFLERLKDVIAEMYQLKTNTIIYDNNNIESNFNELRNIRKSIGYYEFAKKYYDKLFDVCNLYYNESKSMESLYVLAYAYENFGDLYNDLYNTKIHFYEEISNVDNKDIFTLTINNYAKALDLLLSIYYKYNYLSSYDCLLNIYNKLINFETTYNKINLSNKYTIRVIDIIENTNYKIEDVILNKKIAIYFDVLGNAKIKLKEYNSAKEYFLKALKIREYVYEKLKHLNDINGLQKRLESVEDLQKSYENLSSVEYDLNNYDMFSEYNLKYLQIGRKFYQETKYSGEKRIELVDKSKDYIPYIKSRIQIQKKKKNYISIW